MARVLAALVLLSCSDAALPVSSGAASLHWAPSASGAQHPVCVPGDHWSNAPGAASDAPSVTASAISAMVDGRDGAIRCRVAPRGDAYLVSGQIHAGATDVAIDVVIGPGQEWAQGTLYVADDVSDLAFSSDITIVPPKPGCVFSVHPGSGEALGISPGSIWARVQCAHVQDNRNRAKQECQIADGYFVFRDCVRD